MAGSELFLFQFISTKCLPETNLQRMQGNSLFQTSGFEVITQIGRNTFNEQP